MGLGLVALADEIARLEKQGRRFDAIFFQQQEYLPTEVQAVYQLQTNQYNGVQAVQLSLRHWQPVS